MRLTNEYDPPPLYIHENGAAMPDQVGPDGTVDDADRVAYLDGHLRAAHAAIEAGVDLRGYFVWSFLDNFECRGLRLPLRHRPRRLSNPAADATGQRPLVQPGDRAQRPFLNDPGADAATGSDAALRRWARMPPMSDPQIPLIVVVSRTGSSPAFRARLPTSCGWHRRGDPADGLLHPVPQPARQRLERLIGWSRCTGRPRLI